MATGLAAECEGSCTVTPIASKLTEVADWAPTALLSGASVRCGGRQREVYRFTPRCTRAIECTWYVPRTHR